VSTAALITEITFPKLLQVGTQVNLGGVQLLHDINIEQISAFLILNFKMCCFESADFQMPPSDIGLKT
jgi:hypothetical protein